LVVSLTAHSTTPLYTLSLHDALPISQTAKVTARVYSERVLGDAFNVGDYDVRLHPLYKEMKDRVKEKNVTPYIVQGNETEAYYRSEEHTSELQSRFDLVCRLLLEKKK